MFERCEMFERFKVLCRFIQFSLFPYLSCDNGGRGRRSSDDDMENSYSLRIEILVVIDFFFQLRPFVYSGHVTRISGIEGS
jgi:hypothetical protein